MEVLKIVGQSNPCKMIESKSIQYAHLILSIHGTVRFWKVLGLLNVIYKIIHLVSWRNSVKKVLIERL